MKTSDNYITWSRANNDINGNPRYICHYLAFKPFRDQNEPFALFSYEEAIKLANKLGGKKYHNKQYGGGLIFSTYNLRSLSDQILIQTGDFIKYSRKPKTYENKNGNNKLKFDCFLRREVTNKKGGLKKWFKCNDYNFTNSTYSIVK
jgi:hypothetical protein